MRIAITHWSRRKVGGAESYLEAVVPALLKEGHKIGFWHEIDQPTENPKIHLPPQVTAWCAQTLGADHAVGELRRWQPELIYAHGLQDTKVESILVGMAPTIFFAHAYYGTCISGMKRFLLPTARPCDRQFGWPCLANYYPRRCGGLNPLTMWRDYLHQSERLALLHRCRAIVTNSQHMVSEYERYGLSVYRTSLPLSDVESVLTKSPVISLHEDDAMQLLFLGRLHANKGGALLIDATVKALLLLDAPLRLVFAGDGPERASWERHGRRAQTEHPRLSVHFAGHVDKDAKDKLIASSNLLVFPSLWPEPFGLTGLEAGLLGVPAAGFAVGGVPDWLVDGVNGFIAPADPPTAEGLARAIARCLHDPAVYSRLRSGARQVASAFTMEKHLSMLQSVFHQVLSAA